MGSMYQVQEVWSSHLSLATSDSVVYACHCFIINKAAIAHNEIIAALQTCLFVLLRRSHCTELLERHCYNNDSDRLCCSDAMLSMILLCVVVT